MKRNYTKTLCGIIILAILCTLIVACENVQKNVNEASIKDGIAKTFAMVSLQNDNKLNSDSQDSNDLSSSYEGIGNFSSNSKNTLNKLHSNISIGNSGSSSVKPGSAGSESSKNPGNSQNSNKGSGNASGSANKPIPHTHIDLGNTGLWFNSYEECSALYDAENKKWSDMLDRGEISWEEYSASYPVRWSASACSCGKITMSMFKSDNSAY